MTSASAPASPPAARTGARRRNDVLERLRSEHDVWVASAGDDGTPCLVPLSLHWDGTDVWLSTRENNPTGRNLRATGATRLAFGDTDDVVLLDGRVETVTQQEVDRATADAFAARCGWDPRRAQRPGSAYVYFRVTLTAVQAFHGEHELSGRHLMRDGVWLV